MTWTNQLLEGPTAGIMGPIINPLPHDAPF